VANSWRTERWDSLRLLTPNWQSRLPDFGYEGDDPDGFRTMPETIDFIAGYARAISAPVRTHTEVSSVTEEGGEYQVRTTEGTWRSRAVVLATGACNVPHLPPAADAVPSTLCTLTADRYRNPGQIQAGGVLVVGASATGTQIAEELQRSGHPVTIAAGEHVRVPRTYRGRDIKWWMDAVGILDERHDEVDHIERVRSLPSLQLAGSDDHHTVDLNALTGMGVRLVGRLAGFDGGRALFSGSLKNVCALSDLKMNRLLDRIDTWAAEHGLDTDLPSAHRFEATRVEDAPPLRLDLGAEGIRTVFWATGFRPDYSWLHLPVLDWKGRMKHEGGVVVDAPGLYVIGLPFLRRRKSSLIDGAADDARELSAHLERYLDGR
jgi:putative flavoprotein involved in K+ transport